MENLPSVVRGVAGNDISELKTVASRRPISCHPVLMSALLSLRENSPYNQDGDWVFAGITTKGRVPVWPSSLLADHIQPAVKAAGVSKHVSWHVFRHSYATLLKRKLGRCQGGAGESSSCKQSHQHGCVHPGCSGARSFCTRKGGGEHRATATAP
jgi:integrase